MKDARSYYKLERNQSLRGLGKRTWWGSDLRQEDMEDLEGQKDKWRPIECEEQRNMDKSQDSLKYTIAPGLFLS